jgi:Zn-finger nucleic acid-binding protein
MEAQALTGHNGRPVTIDLCCPCQSLWFDQHESVALTPASTLTLFRVIGEHTGRPSPTAAELARCPRCKGRLRITSDLQRHTRFQYLRCPNNHGRLTTFLEFLKEKQFIRALTAPQIAELRANVQVLNCSNCGAPVDLAKASACGHCGSPLTMLDLSQARALVEQLQKADRSGQPIDPALPLNLERARRQTEASFQGLVRDTGLTAFARWLRP